MSTTLKLRDDAILPFTPSADQLTKRGYAVTLSGNGATVSASATTKATGIILEGAATTGQSMIGILGAVSGTVPAKLSGSVTKGQLLQQAADGTWVADAGAGARVVSLLALETGVSGDLIEAAPLTPQTLS